MKNRPFKEIPFVGGVTLVYDVETALALGVRKPYEGPGWRIKGGPTPNVSKKWRQRRLRNLLK
jgi:hypothetical protein